MKIPSRRVVAAIAFRRLQARDPVVFENSFRTLTAPSLSWIDSELLSLSIESDVIKGETFDIEKLPVGSMENENIEYHHRQVVAEALIRRIVFKILDKYNDIASPERVKEALKYYSLPEQLQDDLVTKYGGSPPATWFDALEHLQDYCSNEFSCHDGTRAEGENCSNFDKEAFWKIILDHPITKYVPVQCQSCGKHFIPDSPHYSFRNDTELGLKEEEPLPEEAPFVRTGWFRGPRLVPRVFVLNCPKCGAVSRWFRSRDPQIILNPRRWGRLCGEQEDLRLDLASYFGFILIRTIVPLDWDHVWSEFRTVEDGENINDDDGVDWCIQDNDRNFVARLDEGIGSWTRVLSVSPNPTFCGDVTNSYLSCECEGGRADNRIMHNMERYRQQIIETRADHCGKLTQSGTVNGYALERARLSSSDISSVMKKAAQEYGSRAWYHV